MSNNLTLKINKEVAKKHCDNFCDYAGEFEKILLFERDESSTLVAVQNAVIEFDLFKDSSSQMGQTIKQDAKNMNQKTETLISADENLSLFSTERMTVRN